MILRNIKVLIVFLIAQLGNNSICMSCTRGSDTNLVVVEYKFSKSTINNRWLLVDIKLKSARKKIISYDDWGIAFTYSKSVNPNYPALVYDYFEHYYSKDEEAFVSYRRDFLQVNSQEYVKEFSDFLGYKFNGNTPLKKSKLSRKPRSIKMIINLDPSAFNKVNHEKIIKDNIAYNLKLQVYINGKPEILIIKLSEKDIDNIIKPLLINK